MEYTGRGQTRSETVIGGVKSKSTILERGIVFCGEGCFGCGFVCIVGVNVGECGFGDVVLVALWDAGGSGGGGEGFWCGGTFPNPASILSDFAWVGLVSAGGVSGRVFCARWTSDV